ncbi:bifunctional DNA primase/polymerase [Streptomyces sp. NPDC005279]|uniref:bifunctional DNA primase/polymerase n=1 Tax=Streptomyces sp. NPDC005279 TaxID=3364712 RepID=UPI0036C94323
MTPELVTALLGAAQSAAVRGWPVFPLRPGEKRPALHGEASCPRTGVCAAGHRKWEQRATTNLDVLRQAWARKPFNVAIATGPAGLLVIDLDMPKDKGSSDTPCGVTTFKALCERAGQAVPTTLTVRTASGGRHLYFKAPSGVRLSNSAGKLAPLIDTRAWGGYVVAPGSTIPAGDYEITDTSPVAPLPPWLLDALAPVSKPSSPSVIAPARNATRVAQVALARECAKVAAAVEGMREAVLFESARSMGRFVAWGDIPRHEVEQAFQAAAESAGLKSYECRSTLRSALNWSIRNARPREAV